MKVKNIRFDGGELLGVQADNGKIYMGLNKFLEEIGFVDKVQQQYQRNKLLSDGFIKAGITTLILASGYGDKETYVIELDYIPTAMMKFNPDDLHRKSKSLSETEKIVFRNKLMKYQEKAKDALVKEFLGETETANEFKKDFEFVGQLMNELTEVKVEVVDLRKNVARLIDNTTINSRQAQKLLFAGKDRVSEMLGGAHSETYKTYSRSYFKNMWLDFCKRFEVTTYKDLCPIHVNDAYTFLKHWSMI